jgi:hypothetical protein
MSWIRKLPSPLHLKDARRLSTLRDAADLILSLPERLKANVHWEHAAELMMKAAKPTASAADVEAFGDQFLRALKAERLI